MFGLPCCPFNVEASCSPHAGAALGLKYIARQLSHKLGVAESGGAMAFIFRPRFEAKVIIPVPVTAGSRLRVRKGSATDQNVMGEMNSGDPACHIGLCLHREVPA